MPEPILNPCEDCVSQAAFTKLLMSGNASDFSDSAGGKRLHFLGESLKKYVNKRNDQGITGHLWKLRDRIWDAQDFVYGQIYFAMNAGEMEYLLPLMIGAKDSGTGGSGDFIPTDCADYTNFLIWRDYGIFKYTQMYCVGWRIDSRALQFQEDSLADMVVLATNWIGFSRTLYTANDDAWPTADEPPLGTGGAFAPYFFKHSTLTLLTDDDTFGQYCKAVQLVVDHQMTPRYRMSTTPTQVCAAGRDVDLLLGMDWGPATKELIEQDESLPGSLLFSMDELGTHSTEFKFGALVAVDEDPVSPNKTSEVEWQIRNIAAAHDEDEDGVIGTDEYDISATNTIST
jgi:hypothetical protein